MSVPHAFGACTASGLELVRSLGTPGAVSKTWSVWVWASQALLG